MSNTVILVEVEPEPFVSWTAPRDYSFDPADPGRLSAPMASSLPPVHFAFGFVYSVLFSRFP